MAEPERDDERQPDGVEGRSVIHNDAQQSSVAAGPTAALPTAQDSTTEHQQRESPQGATTTTESVGGQYSDQLNVDAECDRLLRNAKKQVKQMMEEAVTKKFIHEESSSIIALCVAIDACLSHGLKRRALGLFKTNSSTALINKIAKNCPPAQEIQSLVEEEEKRQLADEQQLQAQLQKQQQASNNLDGNNNKLSVGQTTRSSPTKMSSSGKIILASNLSVHRRNLWIKFALIEKKLVDIVEHLAENAPKYYENEALMANYLSAQVFCSLLVGPCALEFSRSKTNDSYQFDEPNAEELLKRHKLSNPIACLCPQSRVLHQHPANEDWQQQQRTNSSAAGVVLGPTGDENALKSATTSSLPIDNGNSKHSQLGRSITHSGSSASRSNNAHAVIDQQAACQRPQHRRRRATASQAMLAASSEDQRSAQRRAESPVLNLQQPADEFGGEQAPKSPSAMSQTSCSLVRAGSRRKPLALKTNVKTGALVTECHHYSCQEISEHQQTRGYSFKCLDDMAAPAVNSAAISNGHSSITGTPTAATTTTHLSSNQQQQENLSVWSPRMLHEILHQNSKSSLLYAKNNVLLETQAHELMAGYLSLHQTSSDLILKWIPNQMINGQAAAGSTSCCCDHTLENDEQLAAKRRTRSEDLLEQRPSGNTNSCCGDNEAAQTVVVGSSYLSLVVSLSVSRIVLLQCQFGQTNTPAAQTKEPEHQHHDADDLDAEARRVPVASSANNYEETLILVEVDGVQRAPFKFPKGGLRWFLSCLENGLFPNKYLDPTICSDSLLNTDTSLINSWLTNPLKSQPHMQADADSSQVLDSPSTATTTSSDVSAPSRLDSFLRRLPAFKRALRSDDSCASSTATPDSNSRTESPTAKPESPADKPANAVRIKTPINYVFRIVSVQQPTDWRFQTPPHSAFSVASSTSSPFALVNGLSKQQATHESTATEPSEQQQQQESTSTKPEQQQFRWSLSRLTRFSSRYSNKDNHQSARSTSTSSFGGIMSSFGRTNSDKAKSAGGSFNWSLRTATENGGSLNDESLDRISLDPNGSASLDTASMRSSSANRKNSDREQPKRNSSREFVRIEAKLSDLKKSSSDELVALRNQSIQTLCESMRRQILARAFYGWLAYCRRTKIIRDHLVKLVKTEDDSCLLDEFADECQEAQTGLTDEKWAQLMEESSRRELSESQLSRRVNQLVYYGGIESDELRVKVWPYMLGHFKFSDSDEEKSAKNKSVGEAYRTSQSEWVKIERVVKQRDNEILAANMAKVARKNNRANVKRESKSSSLSDDAATTTNHIVRRRDKETPRTMSETANDNNKRVDGDGRVENDREFEEDDEVGVDDDDEDDLEEEEEEENDEAENEDTQGAVADSSGQQQEANASDANDSMNSKEESAPIKSQERKRKANKISVKSSSARKTAACRRRKRRFRLESTGSVGSDASVTDRFGNNIHRIDKDVQRCDRNFWYFKDLNNLEKLRNVMCNYVWQHLDVGYVQGMCDLAAPFLVIFDDEILAFTCFNHLMTRMVANFPHGCAMDQHFESLKYLMQVLDPKLFEVLQDNGDYTHFYFCYRWLLLDFKRELAYEDVYRVWETIWSARHVATDHFVVFLALAMVRYYRDIIIENNMDFTDTIKFFNEMAERHDAKRIIALARDSVVELEHLIMGC